MGMMIKFKDGTQFELITKAEAKKIVNFLTALNIKATIQLPFVSINRDSMCNAFQLNGIHEEAHYPETLKRIREFMKSDKYKWSGKTDDVIFLDKQ